MTKTKTMMIINYNVDKDTKMIDDELCDGHRLFSLQLCLVFTHIEGMRANLTIASTLLIILPITVRIQQQLLLQLQVKLLLLTATCKRG